MPARHLIARIAALATITAILLTPSLSSAAPIARSFTYQGELSQSGTPIDGSVTIRFSLWDAAGTGDPPTGGTQVGTSQVVTGVTVDHGLFSTLVNAGGEFGASAFDGNARWLQVEVCTDGSCTSTTVLGPRQAVTASPYALGPWQMNGPNVGYTAGSVGIGTTSPAMQLHVKAVHPAMILQDTDVAGNQTGYLSFWNNNPNETGWVGYGSIGSPQFSVVNVRPAGDIQLYTAAGPSLVVKSAGSVGIGTSAPTAKLEVRGDVKLGASGEYYAPAGTENLRIVRGKVQGTTGNLLFGNGFSCGRSSAGVYIINFNPDFPSGEYPIITASAESSGAARFAMVNFPTHISCTIRIVNGSGTAVDADFYFIAIGPR